MELFDKVIRFAPHARGNWASSESAFNGKLEVFGVGRHSRRDFITSIGREKSAFIFTSTSASTMILLFLFRKGNIVRS